MKDQLFTKKQDIGAIILAGGKSTRFGSDKTLITLHGVPLIQRAINIVKKITDEIIIVTNSPEKFSSLPYPKVKDLIRNRGPLGGIYTGLFYSKHEKNIVIPADMPFVTAECIEFLIASSRESDVTVPIRNGRYEPLCAVYSRSCLTEIKAQLVTGNNQVFAFYDRVKTIEVNFEDNSYFNTEHLFFNINSIQDMEQIEFLGAKIK